ncbi:hypothetical protein RSOLAG1IB_06283 [Rhizoctonia solani AG-1 IB]|uniref:Uncharacterized protein n=1 Tax=Thanatephorus cucumeris (strain AG1-IB / isolate 7/3/14) TaxID=1108050 RepID=A0A0B7F5G4_THACB|nr:hypothetical protein RSOLAG1IB_06283 [Rhizoctonia solani AG-1 IB]
MDGGLDDSTPSHHVTHLAARSDAHRVRYISLLVFVPCPPLLYTTGQGWPPGPRAFPCVSVSRYPSPGRSRAPGDSHPSDIPSQSVIHLLCTYVGIANIYISSRLRPHGSRLAHLG